MGKIKSLKREQKIASICLAVCSINCEVLPYLHHISKLIFGLPLTASATKQK